MAKAAAAATATATAAESEGQAQESAPGATSRKKLVLLGVLGLVLVGGGVGGFLVWKARSAEHAAQEAKPKPPAPLQFHALDPPFVVNFQGAQVVRFLQLDVRVGTRDSDTLDLLRANDPVIRNDLLMLFGTQDATVLATLAGKEQLRTKALEAVRKVVAGAGGESSSVEAVFFTSFVMQ